jgi:hypothetical protein
MLALEELIFNFYFLDILKYKSAFCAMDNTLKLTNINFRSRT